MEAAGFEPCICTGRSTVLLCHAHQFELSFRISYVLNYIRNLRNCKILRVFNDIVILTVAIPGKAYRTEFFLSPNSCILTLYKNNKKKGIKKIKTKKINKIVIIFFTLLCLSLSAIPVSAAPKINKKNGYSICQQNYHSKNWRSKTQAKMEVFQYKNCHCQQKWSSPRQKSRKS